MKSKITQLKNEILEMEFQDSNSINKIRTSIENIIQVIEVDYINTNSQLDDKSFFVNQFNTCLKEPNITTAYSKSIENLKFDWIKESFASCFDTFAIWTSTTNFLTEKYEKEK